MIDSATPPEIQRAPRVFQGSSQIHTHTHTRRIPPPSLTLSRDMLPRHASLFGGYTRRQRKCKTEFGRVRELTHTFESRLFRSLALSLFLSSRERANISPITCANVSASLVLLKHISSLPPLPRFNFARRYKNIISYIEKLSRSVLHFEQKNVEWNSRDNRRQRKKNKRLQIEINISIRAHFSPGESKNLLLSRNTRS